MGPSRRSKKGRQRIPEVAGKLAISLVLVGLACWPGYCSMQHGREIAQGCGSAGWPQTRGRVERAELGRRSGSSTKGRRSRAGYFLDISYRYSVDGQHYHGQRISFGMGHRTSGAKGVLRSLTSRAKAQRLLERYGGKGREVMVFYDPTSPGRSALEVGATPGGAAWFSTIAGGFAALLLLAFALFFGHAAVKGD